MFTATATSHDGTLLHNVDVNGRHEITTDEPLSAGGTDAGPAPHELLPAMLAACVSTTLLAYAKRQDWSLDGISVDVSYDEKSTPREVETIIHFPEGLTQEQVQKLQIVARTCPVKRALEAGFSFSDSFVTASAVAPGR